MTFHLNKLSLEENLSNKICQEKTTTLEGSKISQMTEIVRISLLDKWLQAHEGDEFLYSKILINLNIFSFQIVLVFFCE